VCYRRGREGWSAGLGKQRDDDGDDDLWTDISNKEMRRVLMQGQLLIESSGQNKSSKAAVSVTP